MVKHLTDLEPTGTTLGQTSADLVSLHGVTPIARASLVSIASGSLGDANTAINAIIVALHNKGITTKS